MDRFIRARHGVPFYCDCACHKLTGAGGGLGDCIHCAIIGADEREQAFEAWRAQRGLPTERRARVDDGWVQTVLAQHAFNAGYDAAVARAEQAEAMVAVLREALESTGPCEPSGTKCSAHNYNRLPCEVAAALAKLA